MSVGATELGLIRAVGVPALVEFFGEFYEVSHGCGSQGTC